MDGLDHLAISLYNVIHPVDQNLQILTSESEPPLRSNELPFVHMSEIGISLYGPEENENSISIFIGPVAGLSHGQLIIDAPRLLNHKTWCIQLPRRRILNQGLTITLFRPGQVSNPTLTLDTPPLTGTAILQIAMPTPTEGEAMGVVSCEAGTVRAPILTEVSMEEPQGALMLMARTLAFRGAYSRLANQQPPTSET